MSRRSWVQSLVWSLFCTLTDEGERRTNEGRRKKNMAPCSRAGDMRIRSEMLDRRSQIYLDNAWADDAC